MDDDSDGDSQQNILEKNTMRSDTYEAGSLSGDRKRVCFFALYTKLIDLTKTKEEIF